MEGQIGKKNEFMVSSDLVVTCDRCIFVGFGVLAHVLPTKPTSNFEKPPCPLKIRATAPKPKPNPPLKIIAMPPLLAVCEEKGSFISLWDWEERYTHHYCRDLCTLIIDNVGV